MAMGWPSVHPTPSVAWQQGLTEEAGVTFRDKLGARRGWAEVRSVLAGQHLGESLGKSWFTTCSHTCGQWFCGPCVLPVL